MGATHQRRAALVGAAVTGALVLAGSAGADGGPGPSGAPDGQLVQASDGTLYLLVGGEVHPITPTPLTDEALRLLPTGDAIPDGAFWLAPTAPASATRFFATQTALAPRGGSTQRVASAGATATVQAGYRRSAAQATAMVPRSTSVRPFGQS